MKMLFIAIISLLLFSCKKNEAPANQGPIKLIRKEATNYNGELVKMEYVYDAQGRITTIKKAINSAPLSDAVTITYNGNEITLVSQPVDPNNRPHTFDKIVRLTVDASGKLLRKIGYAYLENGGLFPFKRFLYDTLTCEYDPAGYLLTTTRNFVDSSRSIGRSTYEYRVTNRDSLTTIGGNLTRKIEHLQFTHHTTNDSGATTYFAAGTATKSKVYSYTKSYPNKADFKNIIVLNETQDFEGLTDYYNWMDLIEPFAAGYQNIADNTEVQNVERDNSGNITDGYTTNFEFERTYTADSLLSTVDALTPGTYYIKIRYFYSR